MVISRIVRNGLKWVLLPVLVSGCQFSSGSGDTDTDTDTEGADTESAETGATSAPSTTTSSSTTAGMSTGSSSSTPDSTSIDPSSSTGDESTSTGSDPACEFFTEWIWATDVPDDATTLAKTPSPILPLIDEEEVIFLRATVGGEGTAALAFDVPCSDEVILWALAWDADGDVGNADAYQIGLDQDTKQVADSGARWEYGCDNDTRQWAWYRVRDTGRRCDPGGEVEPTLEAGEHHLQINNAEPVSGDPQFNFTGLAALVVTNDPDFDPRMEYDPNARG